MTLELLHSDTCGRKLFYDPAKQRILFKVKPYYGARLSTLKTLTNVSRDDIAPNLATWIDWLSG